MSKHEQVGHGGEVDPGQAGLIARVRNWIQNHTERGQFGMTNADQEDFLGGKVEK